ncbi:2-acylglycerol O-acyltransferase [Aureococcus anophagefferens]|nr:2-acylglycerol O-acyltransferase [Aureococcus anophagefferens]
MAKAAPKKAEAMAVYGATSPPAGIGPRLHTLLVVVVFHAVYLVGPALCLLTPPYLALRGGLRWDASKKVALILLWSLLFSWFPVTIETPADLKLDGGKIYVFAVHPHGVLAFNRAAFGFDIDTLWNAAFPGVDFPRAHGDGRSILVYPGGEREQILTRRGEHVLYLSKRKGFVKIALEHGAELVPMYAFGDTDLFEHHAFLLGFRKWLVRTLGVAIPLITGSVGLLPHRRPVRIVVGAPLPCPCADGCPTQKDVDAAHAAYVAALRALFDAHKARCGHAAAELVIT